MALYWAAVSGLAAYGCRVPLAGEKLEKRFKLFNGFWYKRTSPKTYAVRTENKDMTRTTAREIALQLGFAATASEDFAQDVLDAFFEPEHYASLSGESPLFQEYPDERQMRYIRTLVQLIFDHRVQLDAYIQKYASGWRVDRISKTAAAIMRASMCEILYMDEVPNAAAINEAVELAKRYAENDTAAFINGVLGSFVRGELDAAEAPADESASPGGPAPEL